MSIELRDVSLTYPGVDRPVLDDVTLVVSPGESVAVMAPSGEGKSTLMAVAGLLLTPTRGEVRVCGVVRSVKEASVLLGPVIGWILQSVNLLPRRTVLDNVLLPARMRGLCHPAMVERAGELLHQVGLAGLESRMARTLSGGEAQRVGVARSLLLEPAVLLADEPTANLDGVTGQAIVDSLLAARGRTAVLMTTHDTRVARLTSRTLRLDGGRLLDSPAPEPATVRAEHR